MIIQSAPYPCVSTGDQSSMMILLLVKSSSDFWYSFLYRQLFTMLQSSYLSEYISSRIKEIKTILGRISEFHWKWRGVSANFQSFYENFRFLQGKSIFLYGVPYFFILLKVVASRGKNYELCERT